jgi:hypothetical protein
VSVYGLDPDTGLPREPVVPEPVRCPDGGACHHGCATACFRVRWMGPLSGVYPGDQWPDDVRAAAGPAPEPDVVTALLSPGTGPAEFRQPAFSDDAPYGVDGEWADGTVPAAARKPGVPDTVMAALKAIYVQAASGTHTVSGQKAWIRALAATALNAAGIPAGADIKRGDRVVTLWHGDIDFRLLEEPGDG